MGRWFIFLFGLLSFCYFLFPQWAYSGSKLFIHVGKNIRKDQATHWGGHEKKENIGQLNLGITYKTAFSDRLIDFNIRTEFNSYQWDKDTRLVKFSLLPLITLPSVDSLFPFYLGLSGGVGTFFFNPDYEDSYFTLDYQLLVGFRLIDLFNRLGVFVEVSRKSHIFFMDKGKYQGFYLSLGVFFGF